MPNDNVIPYFIIAGVIVLFGIVLHRYVQFPAQEEKWDTYLSCVENNVDPRICVEMFDRPTR